MGEAQRTGILRALDALAREAAARRDDLSVREGADFAVAVHAAALRMDELAHRVRCEANSLLSEARMLAEAALRYR